MDLTLGLTVLALCVLVAVGLHSRWQARRAGPRRADALPGAGARVDQSFEQHVDQRGDQRVEPRLDAQSVAPIAGVASTAGNDIAWADGVPGAADPHAEISLTGPQPLNDAAVGPNGQGPHSLTAATLSEPALLRLPPVRRAARLDALVDLIVPLTVDQPVSGEAALAHAPASRRAGNKPMIIEGLDVDTGDWETLAHGRSYSEFQAGVQLANRSGALNEIEYSEFVQKVQHFAEGVSALPDFPDMLEVVARARELDQFASPLDAQLSLRLRAQGAAWSLGYLHQCAARRGFMPGALPGRLVMHSSDEAAPPMLVLSFDPQAALAEDVQASAVREVSLSLDVPQTEEAAEPYPAWHRAATALAAEMDAEVVDDQGQPVTLHAFDAIAKDLTLLYRQLESRDLAAGSAAARRLFS